MGQADTYPFSTKKIAFPYQKYGKNKDSEFSGLNNFCPSALLLDLSFC